MAQRQQRQRAAVPILLDTDMGSDCDDAGALAVLHALARQGEAEILGCVYSSDANPHGAGCVAAINAYFGMPQIPVAALQDRSFGDPRELFSGGVANDTGAYGHRIVTNAQAMDLVEFYRGVLCAQADHSLTLVTIGHLRGLFDFCQEAAHARLLADKVSRWVCMGGKFPASGARGDWNFAANGACAYTKAVIEAFPGEITFLGQEAGVDIVTGMRFGELPEKHPVRRCYAGFNGHAGLPLEAGRPSWDPLAVLYAVRGAQGMWERVGPGWCRVDAQGCVQWEPSPQGQHYYLRQKQPPQKIAAALEELIYLP